MSTSSWTLLIFGGILAITNAAIKLDTIKHCCDLGTNYANSGLKCNTFQTPIAGISKNDESFCMNSVDVCCKKEYRAKQCLRGKEDAKSGKGCIASPDRDDFRRDCCEACEIGLDAASSSQSCTSVLGLGEDMDTAFTECCLSQLPTTSSTYTSTSTTPTRSPPTRNNLDNYNPRDSPPPPVLEELCDIPDLCAQICMPVEDSYKCDCYKGYTLMDDGISCKPSKRNAKATHRCERNNPCDQECIDTGVAIKCSCWEGYELASDKRTCKDIDECTLGIHDCTNEEICINMIGDYDCQGPDDSDSDSDIGSIGYDDKCPEGYKFDGENMLCNDINECEIAVICPKPSQCINTIGSFICKETETPKCPPGFYFKDSIQSCDDVDECITGKNDCNQNSQICLNTKGNYTCIDKASKRNCPPGFKKNTYTQLCEDINECLENNELCGENEECVNEPGGHNCIKKYKPSSAATPEQAKNYPTSSTHPHSRYTPPVTRQQKPTIPSTPSVKPPQTILTSVNPWRPSTYPQTPAHPDLRSSQHPQPNYAHRYPTSVVEHSTPATTPRQTQVPTEAQPRYNTPASHKPHGKAATCPTGQKFSKKYRRCIDIDECAEGTHTCDSTQDCYNTPGSFVCTCKIGFKQDYQIGACIDINECQVGQHDCSEAQRCDNTIGSYLCSRTTGCGTGYTLNSATGLCEDDDECTLGKHNCQDLGAKFKCRNTLGSYRCERIKCVGECITRRIYTTTRYVPSRTVPTSSYPVISGQLKKCLPGYKMNAHGSCEDIDECQSSPCARGEKCLNLNGRYQCIPYIHCRSGYELNDAGDGCIDINECTRGTHKCKNGQICKNGLGYYVCQCPPGHKLNRNNECEDINECEFYRGRICSINAECVNTVGSYRCTCKEGFKEEHDGCRDINECAETPGLCHHNCINVWGGHRCSCERGFILNSDNRTCTDVDECEKFKDRKLCIGTCDNTPGSYTCRCPSGYRLGADGRTCQDIDECQRKVCPYPDDICFNTRGDYKCHTISCPRNYIKDPEHPSRCKRASNVCDIRDLDCIRMPEQYSYHFVTFVSNLPIPDEGRIDFFKMKGPSWQSSSADFTMTILNARSTPSVQRADDSFFRMKRDFNTVVIAVVRPIEGPQEIELQLQMQLYINGAFRGKVVSNIFIYVSEYPF